MHVYCNILSTSGGKSGMMFNSSFDTLDELFSWVLRNCPAASKYELDRDRKICTAIYDGVGSIADRYEIYYFKENANGNN